MNLNVTHVINPKSLEKQIKLYDNRLQVLKEEVDELEKLRAACQLLLGGSLPAEAPAAEAVESAKAGKGKKASAKTSEEESLAEEDFTPEPTVEAPQAEM